MMSNRHTQWQEVLIMGFIWAVVGVIYSAILVAMLAFFRHFDVGAMAMGLAAALAGAVGALFYGSLRLAFLATVSALIAAFGFLAAMPTHSVGALDMLCVSGLAGLIVGAHYGHLMTDSRVQQATAKTLTGLYAGFVAGLLLVLLRELAGGMYIAVAAAMLTPLTGILYVLAVPRIIILLEGQPPALISGALVGGGVAALNGVAVWAFAGIFNSAITGNATEVVRFAWAVLPGALLGGMIGGFLAGALLAAVGINLLNNAVNEATANIPPRGV